MSCGTWARRAGGEAEGDEGEEQGEKGADEERVHNVWGREMAEIDGRARFWRGEEPDMEAGVARYKKAVREG